MAVDTRNVVERRKLRFERIEDILAEAERLSAGPVKPLGNWTPGQVFKHLAIVMEGSIDGIPLHAPWYMRLLGWMIKPMLLNKGMPAGYKLSESAEQHVVPTASISTEVGLEALRSAVQRQLTVAERQPSPWLGTMTRDEWNQMHCRHAELHMGFLSPEK